MSIFVNKFQIKTMRWNGEKNITSTIKAGTCFRIEGIGCFGNIDSFELVPLSKIDDLPFIPVSVAMLEKGFTETQYIPEVKS